MIWTRSQWIFSLVLLLGVWMNLLLGGYLYETLKDTGKVREEFRQRHSIEQVDLADNNRMLHRLIDHLPATRP